MRSFTYRNSSLRNEREQVHNQCKYDNNICTTGQGGTAGGAGGRVAVYYHESESSCTLSAYGGRSTNLKKTGGAGTVYEEHILASRSERKLIIGNKEPYQLFERGIQKVGYCLLNIIPMYIVFPVKQNY